jgi:hypothetical protein
MFLKGKWDRHPDILERFLHIHPEGFGLGLDMVGIRASSHHPPSASTYFLGGHVGLGER